MKVQVEMKVTILDGEEKGLIFEEKPIIAETVPIGLAEEVTIRWAHLRPDMHYVSEFENITPDH